MQGLLVTAWNAQARSPYVHLPAHPDLVIARRRVQHANETGSSRDPSSARTKISHHPRSDCDTRSARMWCDSSCTRDSGAAPKTRHRHPTMGRAASSLVSGAGPPRMRGPQSRRWLPAWCAAASPCRQRCCLSARMPNPRGKSPASGTRPVRVLPSAASKRRQCKRPAMRD